MKQRTFSYIKLGLIVFIGIVSTGCTTAINRSLTQVEAEESFNKGDFKRSFQLTEAMAYQGDKKAQYTLGYMYFYGIGTPKIPALGIAWMQQAALKGYAPAEVALSMINQIPKGPAICSHSTTPITPTAQMSMPTTTTMPAPAAQIAPRKEEANDQIALKTSHIPSIADSYPAIAKNSYIPPLTEADRVFAEDSIATPRSILIARIDK